MWVWFERIKMLTLVNEAEIIHSIKAKEVKSGRCGSFFITRKNGVMKTVSLTLEQGMIVANGREIFDLNDIEVISLGRN